ncbi:MAG: saccharopine dehydrogenase family protein [Gemmatimonadota bacterium]
MSLLIYGANGYTGRLIVDEAVRRGLRPILSGRSADAVRALAETHGLEARPAALGDPRAMDQALRGVTVVLHCAGPFHRTVEAMTDACLRNGASYLDITGEIAVFERVARLDARAKARGITMLPGVGFDVVPTDCLASHLHARLPSATHLELAFSGGTGPSHGTALTVIDGLGLPGAIRRDGRIVPVPSAWRTRTVAFFDKARLCVSIPWGDVSTAFHSTRIPNIVTYMSSSAGAIRSLRWSRWLAPLLRTELVRGFARARVRKAPAGPSAAALARTRSQVWGEARDASGRIVSARLEAPTGYVLTAQAAVRAAERVLAGGVPTGFLTPSKAFGADFILSLPDTRREDLA